MSAALNDGWTSRPYGSRSEIVSYFIFRSG